MRSKPMLFCALLWGMGIAGCNRNGAVEDFSQALVESRDEGTIAWNIRADGTVKAMIKSREDKPILANVSGKMVTDGATIELTPVEGTGVLEGKGLKLATDLTRAKYDLVVEGKPWEGTLFIPAGGTADLAAGARAALAVKLPDAKIGPHGGKLQAIGKGDVVEVVAYGATGELRVYMLDPELKPVAAVDREVKIGLESDSKAELIALVPEPGGAYFTGKIGINVDPIEVMIWSKAKAEPEAEVALVGFQPGVAFALGAMAPRVKIMAKAEAPPNETDVNVRADVKGTAGVAGDVKTGVDIKPPDVKLKGAVNPSVPTQADVGVHAGTLGLAKTGAGISGGASAGVSAGAKAGAETKSNSDKAVKSGAKLQVKLP